MTNILTSVNDYVNCIDIRAVTHISIKKTKQKHNFDDITKFMNLKSLVMHKCTIKENNLDIIHQLCKKINKIVCCFEIMSSDLIFPESTMFIKIIKTDNSVHLITFIQGILRENIMLYKNLMTKISNMLTKITINYYDIKYLFDATNLPPSLLTIESYYWSDDMAGLNVEDYKLPYGCVFVLKKMTRSYDYIKKHYMQI